MRVVDTSAWIEWIAESAVGNVVRAHFPGVGEWVVPTIVQLELLKWTMRVLEPSRSDEIFGLTQTMVVVPLTTPIAAAAAKFALAHQLPTADAIIYATAREMNSDLLTCDGHFEGLDGVIYVPKMPA